MHRLFVGLRPPPPIRKLLMDVMHGVTGARWQDDEQLHLTLRFIGEVEKPIAEDIALVLSHVAGKLGPLRMGGVGRFAAKERVNTLWAGIQPREPLASLHRKVDKAITRVGIEPEQRAYLPHVTLARLNAPEADVSRWLRDNSLLASMPFRATHLVLYESHLGHGGATYEAIARYRLEQV